MENFRHFWLSAFYSNFMIMASSSSPSSTAIFFFIPNLSFMRKNEVTTWMRPNLLDYMPIYPREKIRTGRVFCSLFKFEFGRIFCVSRLQRGKKDTKNLHRGTPSKNCNRDTICTLLPPPPQQFVDLLPIKRAKFCQLQMRGRDFAKYMRMF